MKLVKVRGLGRYLPERVLTNADLEKMVDTSDEWITTRTGIKERRLVPEGQAASDLGTKASLAALSDAGLKPENLELIIVATITGDMQFPSTSCLVQAKIGAKNAACFDIGAACSGFVYGLIVAEQFIKNGIYSNALVIGAEVLSSVTDWQDRNTCVLFGDGAGACILERSNDSSGIISSYLGSDGTQGELLYVPAGGSLRPASEETIKNRLHYLKMSGSEVFKLAVKAMAEAANKALKKAGLSCRDVKCLIPHQANIRIIEAMAKKIGLSLDKIHLNIEKYGNMSSASTAVGFCEAVQEGHIKKGDIVVLVAFGSGLTWGACVLRW